MPSMYQCIIHGVGCIIVYEYSYFCLQGRGNLQDVIALAIKQYEDSGTQASVFQDLQEVLQALDHVTMQPLILDIILRNRMSKQFK
ncbi:hypothetical protein SCLCIDRAFT_1225338 [Scleroderma citrinum Foug A]|uniref:Uncharacterized protein n=1 Tax=Scleroderma citrinum Foug A TaxID=1036808 RepID=A0A0C3D214_9AGAM|nr:hypothetical protein SCLCIDRAFT_1225338 [Scleroderma citrinum Foug A]